MDAIFTGARGIVQQRSSSRDMVPKETSHGTGHVAVEFFGVRGFKRTEQQQEIVISALTGLEEVREIYEDGSWTRSNKRNLFLGFCHELFISY